MSPLGLDDSASPVTDESLRETVQVERRPRTESRAPQPFEEKE